jgi:hypothetical protein
MEMIFNETRGGHGIYGYTMKIENDMCTWSCDRSEVQQWMHVNNPPYKVPSYIPKSIKELIEMSANTSQRFTMWEFANNLKNVLTVTLKDELDDIILHHVKELKETKEKLKETEDKLKETEDKFKLLQITHNDLIINNNNLKNNYINDKKEIIKKCKSEITRLNDDVNKNSSIQSNNLEITIENKKVSRQLEDITDLYELYEFLLTKQSENKLKELNDKLNESENKLKELYDKQKNMIIVSEEC